MCRKSLAAARTLRLLRGYFWCFSKWWRKIAKTLFRFDWFVPTPPQQRKAETSTDGIVMLYIASKWNIIVQLCRRGKHFRSRFSFSIFDFDLTITKQSYSIDRVNALSHRTASIRDDYIYIYVRHLCTRRISSQANASLSFHFYVFVKEKMPHQYQPPVHTTGIYVWLFQDTPDIGTLYIHSHAQRPATTTKGKKMLIFFFDLCCSHRARYLVQL